MRPRRAWELAALALALAVWSFLGWDSSLWDARAQLALHLVAVAAIAALAVLALRGAELPRTRLELPILVLLLAFGIASLSAWNAGLSARAMVAIIGTTAMLPLALLALRHRPGWTGLAVTLPIIALGAVALAVLAWRRLEWVLAGGPGLPPVRLSHEGTPFGSVAVPPFVILAALPLALAIPWRRTRRTVLALLAGLGIPLTVLSGSRSAWIAITLAALVVGAPWAARRLRTVRLPCRFSWRQVALVVAAVAMAALALVYIAPRLDDVSSVIYRGQLWRDTLTAWSGDPAFGIGPGSMPWARQAAAPDLSSPLRQPHSHNVLLGILGDAGVLGLGAALALAVAFVLVAGPWRQRTLAGRASFAVLVGLAGGLMFEDLTFLPNFNLEVVLLAALALTGADAVRWRRAAVRWRSAAVRVAAWLPLAAGSAALLLVFLTGDIARLAYDAGIEAAERGQWDDATVWLRRSVAIDPSQPSGPKSLAVAAAWDGQRELAISAARRAVELNPGDGLSWANLAVLCREGGDSDCAQHAADRAVATADDAGPQLVNAAVTYDRLGDTAAADDAYRRSLLTNWWTAITVPWPRPVEVSLEEAAAVRGSVSELNVLVARGFAGDRLDPGAYSSPAARMLAAAATGDRELALELADELEAAASDSAAIWQLVAMVREHFGLPAEHELAVARVAYGGPLPAGPASVPPSFTDIASFRAYPADGLVPGATRLLPQRPWPWALEPMLAPG
jgi:O-antigen ligase/tetratricopeptide (TPR) repeat protein